MVARLAASIGVDAAEWGNLIDQMPDMALVVTDRELRYVMAAGPALERAGWRAEELVGHRAQDFVLAGMARPVEDHMAAALRGESTKVAALPGTHSDVIWDAWFSPLRGGDGAVTGVIFLLRDVTAQHRLGEKAQASQDLFRSTVDVLQDAFGVLSAVRDDSGRIVDMRAEYANPPACVLFQRPLEQLVGERLLNVLPSMVPLGQFGHLVHTVETGEPTEYEAPWFEEDVLAGAFEVRGVKLGDGIVVTMRDITSRVRAEQQLRASEQRYRVTMDSAAAGMANVGPDGRFRRVNHRFCEITGYSEEEMLALKFQDITHPSDLETDIRQLRQLAAGDIPWYAMEKRYLRKDGAVVWVLLTAAALRDEHGQAYEYVATVTDVTAQKRAQDEVRRLNIELEQRVRERTSDLEAANRDLEAFSYTVSHDLRAPLTTLSGFAEMLSEEFGGRLGDTGREYLSRIRASSKRMDDLIHDLLTLSAASRAEIHLTEVDLSDLARTTTAALRAHDPGRQVRVTIQDDVHACGDERLLRTVVENLLGNAWKFTAKTPSAAIEFAALPGGSTTVHCYVRDNGAGFNPVDAGKLFQPFSRLHPGKDFPGTGVGLASVRRIIERHHGHYWAEGQPGRGAVFHFTLPAGKPLRPQTAPRGPRPAQPRGRGSWFTLALYVRSTERAAVDAGSIPVRCPPPACGRCPSSSLGRCR